MAKIKQKTKRAAAKRFKTTASGKFVFRSAGRRHLLSRHKRKGKRIARNDQVARNEDGGSLKRQLPYL